MVKFVLLILFVVPLSSQSLDKAKLAEKDTEEITTDFINLFVGKWRVLPDYIQTPLSADNNSCAWTSDFLNKDFDPGDSEMRKVKFFLGLEKSPDKIISEVYNKDNAGITIIETKQMFAVRLKPREWKRDVASILKIIKQDDLRFFSEKAQAVIINHINDCMAEKPLYKQKFTWKSSNHPLLLSSKILRAGSLLYPGTFHRWQNVINLIWFKNDVYIVFHKLQGRNYHLGLDWFSKEIREQLGLPIRDANK